MLTSHNWQSYPPYRESVAEMTLREQGDVASAYAKPHNQPIGAGHKPPPATRRAGAFTKTFRPGWLSSDNFPSLSP
jgi:hypothetical protein